MRVNKVQHWVGTWPETTSSMRAKSRVDWSLVSVIDMILSTFRSMLLLIVPKYQLFVSVDVCWQSSMYITGKIGEIEEI